MASTIRKKKTHLKNQEKQILRKELSRAGVWATFLDFVTEVL